MADKGILHSQNPRKFHKGEVTEKSTKAHMEVDIRKLITTPSGIYFRERIEEAGLTPRLGDDNWFVNRSYYKSFRDSLEIKEDNKLYCNISPTNEFLINREFIARMTGLSCNPHVSSATMREYFTAEVVSNNPIVKNRIKTELADQVAPYLVPEEHVDQAASAIKTVALQENQALVAKWFTLNFLGLEGRHIVVGRTAYFLKHLSDGDLISRGWCPCRAILAQFRHLAEKKDGMNLPCLGSKIWAQLKKLKNRRSDFPVREPPKPFIFVNSHITGYWFGERLEGENAPMCLKDDLRAWSDLKERVGLDHLGGGYIHAPRKLNNVRVEPVVEEEHPHVECAAGLNMDIDQATEQEPPQIPQEVTREARTQQVYHRRRKRTQEEHAADAPPHYDAPASFTPYVIPNIPNAPYCFPPLPGAQAPTAGYFYPDYVQNLAADPYSAGVASLRMHSMQLQMLNNLHLHFQTGFRFPPDEAGSSGSAPPPPPQDSDDE